MSRYKAYPAYKDSGVEWLGEIPENWVATRLKRVISRLESGVSVNATDVPAQEGEIGVLKTSCVYTRSFRPLENKAVFQDETHRVKCPVKNGAIIISRMNTPELVGASALVECETESLYLPDRLWQTESLSLFPKFVAYFMMTNGFRAQISLAAEGASSSMQNIAKENYLAIHAAHPISRLEQERISVFLDHETAKIDALIEKQQRLIELLKEKRQAVISHAVTKGLNPNSPMKNSGVEWLGEVPAHWGIQKLGRLFSDSNERALTKEELEYPILSVSINHGISDKELDDDELDRKVARSEDKSLYKTVKKNHLVYNMMRAWQGGFGASTLSGLVSPAYVVCKPKTLINSQYFELVLRTSNAVAELKKYSRGITDFRLRLYWDEFKNIQVPVPPESEISDLLKAISETNSVYDKLVAVAQKQIELLQERRTALISAAVTGKIDVRDWQPAAA